MPPYSFQELYLIFEIFYSLQGESSRMGWPTIFIRLSGCPMRCHYCDTAYAFQGGSMMDIEDIMASIKKYSTRYVTVTGGEPLAQKEVIHLLKTLADSNYEVSIETGGGLSIKEVDPRIKIILDIKTPESGEEKKNYWENLTHQGASRQWLKEIVEPKNDLGVSVKRRIEEMMKPYLDMVRYQNPYLMYFRVGALRTQPKAKSQYKNSGSQLHADYPETV